MHIQYRHLIPAPVDRTSASAWLYKKPMNNISNNKLRILILHITCESKLRSVVRSSVHPCSGHWVAIGRAVVYHSQAAHAFCAGIKCRLCRRTSTPLSRYEKVHLKYNMADHSGLIYNTSLLA